MNKKLLLVILTISICTVAIILNTYLVHTNHPDVSYDMYLTVDDNVGVNADADAIWFGTVPPAGKGTRQLSFGEGNAGLVVIKTSGELAKWVSVSDNNFIIEANATKTVKVIVSVPADAERRDYVGKLNVYSS